MHGSPPLRAPAPSRSPNCRPRTQGCEQKSNDCDRSSNGGAICRSPSARQISRKSIRDPDKRSLGRHGGRRPLFGRSSRLRTIDSRTPTARSPADPRRRARWLRVPPGHRFMHRLCRPSPASCEPRHSIQWIRPRQSGASWKGSHLRVYKDGLRLVNVAGSDSSLLPVNPCSGPSIPNAS
jgi:hypothetical protein